MCVEIIKSGSFINLLNNQVVDEACTWVCSECLLFFAVSVLDGVVSPRSLVPDAESAVPGLPKIAIHAHSPAQVRGPCWYACVLSRGDGIGQTKERDEYA